MSECHEKQQSSSKYFIVIKAVHLFFFFSRLLLVLFHRWNGFGTSETAHVQRRTRTKQSHNSNETEKYKQYDAKMENGRMRWKELNEFEMNLKFAFN